MSLPNMITLGRMVLVPFVVWLIISGQNQWAFWLFLLAGISDAVDGFIAKQFNQATLLGAYLDPLADKLLLVSIYVTFGVVEILPPWLVILVVSRDVLVVLGLVVTWLLDRPIQIRPLMISKINTTLQIALAGFALGRLGYGLRLSEIQDTLVILVALLAFASLAAYFVVWARHMAGSPEVQPTESGKAPDPERSPVR
ncbi:MAG: CDP-alcohol phosphatidyltransferase family protein [Alphaproteobacteria bacterium]